MAMAICLPRSMPQHVSWKLRFRAVPRLSTLPILVQHRRARQLPTQRPSARGAGLCSDTWCGRRNRGQMLQRSAGEDGGGDSRDVGQASPKRHRGRRVRGVAPGRCSRLRGLVPGALPRADGFCTFGAGERLAYGNMIGPVPGAMPRASGLHTFGVREMALTRRRRNNPIAQGNALGTGTRLHHPALKGHHAPHSKIQNPHGFNPTHTVRHTPPYTVPKTSCILPGTSSSCGVSPGPGYIA